MRNPVKLPVILEDQDGDRALGLGIDTLVIAGWTGRDQAAMEAHIVELEDLGIPRPARTPIYYRCAASLLTTRNEIEVAGATSSGEAEYILLSSPDGLLIGVGSDHTDREVEKAGVTISKQLCAKPISDRVWRLSDVAGHWDRLVLSSSATIDGEWRLYQEGPVTTMRDPLDLVRGFTGGGTLPVGTAMFCGTLAVIGGIEPASEFTIELHDPVLGRTLSHTYAIKELPIEG